MRSEARIRLLLGSEAVQSHFGFLAQAVTLDNPTSSARTQQLMGWEPVHPGLIADLYQGHNFMTE